MKNMLYRSPITGFLGFDEVFDRLDKDLSKAFNKVTYPPYNIIKILDSKNQSADHLDYEDAKIIGYTIEVALAGFQKDEIKVSRDGRELTITAHKNDKDAHIYQYVYKGISERMQTVIDERLAFPILIGRPSVIETRIQRLGLRMKVGVDFEMTNIDDDPRFNDYWQQYHALTERRGVSPAAAKNLLRSRPTLIASLMVERGEADAMICGLVGRFHKKLGYMRSVFGLDPGVQCTSAMTGVINDQGAWFFLDTHVQVDPTAEQIAEATLQASYRLKLFGIEPKVALLSHSNYGSHDNPSAAKMRKVYQLLKSRVPKLEIDGEMQADTAWDEGLRTRMFPNTTLTGRANLFVMPNLDAANITYNMVRVMTDGVAIGPILMGIDKPAHILTPASTPRRVVNMTAIAAVDAQIRGQMGR